MATTAPHTPRSNARRKRLMNSREAGKVGHRYYAFYRGHKARRAGNPENPYNPDTADHAAWDAGWRYAEAEADFAKTIINEAVQCLHIPYNAAVDTPPNCDYSAGQLEQAHSGQPNDERMPHEPSSV